MRISDWSSDVCSSDLAPSFLRGCGNRGAGSMPERSMLEWVLIGTVVGVIARLLMPGRDPGGFAVAILIAIVGAMIGGMIAQMPGWPIGEGRGNDIAAGFGAMALMRAYRRVLARRTRALARDHVKRHFREVRPRPPPPH